MKGKKKKKNIRTLISEKKKYTSTKGELIQKLKKKLIMARLTNKKRDGTNKQYHSMGITSGLVTVLRPFQGKEL